MIGDNDGKVGDDDDEDDEHTIRFLMCPITNLTRLFPDQF